MRVNLPASPGVRILLSPISSSTTRGNGITRYTRPVTIAFYIKPLLVVLHQWHTYTYPLSLLPATAPVSSKSVTERIDQLDALNYPSINLQACGWTNGTCECCNTSHYHFITNWTPLPLLVGTLPVRDSTQTKIRVSQRRFDERLANAFKTTLVPGFTGQVDHTFIVYGPIKIIHFFFNDRTMINVESYMIESIISLEPKASIVQSETINGPVCNHKWPKFWSNRNNTFLFQTRVDVTCNSNKNFQKLRTTSFISWKQKSHIRPCVSANDTLQVRTPLNS